MNKKLPDGWIIKKSRKTNEIYYFNEKTKKAQWEFPVESNKKVIGEGTYGCVIKEPLECENNGKKYDYKDKVSKVLTKRSGLDELQEMKDIAKIKGIDKYALNVPKMCKPKLSREFYNVVSNCRGRSVSRTFQNEINQLRLLILENGGNDLNTIKNKIYPTFSNDDKKKFFTSLLTLIDGVDFFVKNNTVHHDIKEGNIVYNIDTGISKFIDFGLATKKDKIIKEAKGRGYGFAVSHSYFPPETSCLNKFDFNNNNNSKCAKLKKHFKQHDLFLEKAVDSFDLYCLSFAFLDLTESLQYQEEEGSNISNFLEEIEVLFKDYTRQYLPDRSTNILSLKKDYKELLELYNMYDTNKPTPSIESIQLSNKHSFAINTEHEKQCPPSKPDYNPKTKKCVAKCKDNKMRNENFRCVTKKNSINLKPQNEIQQNMNSTRRRSASYSRMPNNRNNTTKKCSPDKILNPNTNRCVKKCKPNQMRNKDFRCVSKKNKKAALDMSLL